MPITTLIPVHRFDPTPIAFIHSHTAFGVTLYRWYLDHASINMVAIGVTYMWRYLNKNKEQQETFC